MVLAVGHVGCRSSRKSDECRSFLDVDARLGNDSRTYADPKTPAETAQNWLDAAKALQAEHDALQHMVFHDENLALWGNRLRDELPFQARVARHLAAATRIGDAASVLALEAEWNDRRRRILAVVDEAKNYCGGR